MLNVYKAPFINCKYWTSYIEENLNATHGLINVVDES
jgi:hypothetical protein